MSEYIVDDVLRTPYCPGDLELTGDPLMNLILSGIVIGHMASTHASVHLTLFQLPSFTLVGLVIQSFPVAYSRDSPLIIIIRSQSTLRVLIQRAHFSQG